MARACQAQHDVLQVLVYMRFMILTYKTICIAVYDSNKTPYVADWRPIQRPVATVGF